MEKTINIAFRGLMVLNYQGSPGAKTMEIGFLDARSSAGHGGGHSHVHIPRVLTMENGVLADLLDFRNPPAAPLLGKVRKWGLNVVSPTAHTQVTLRGTGPAKRIDAPTNDNRQDFGWIIDFEARDMHDKNLTREISTARLMMVLTVKQGEFFTKLISPFLEREEKGGETEDFGYVAAVTGLEIKCNVADNEEAVVDLMAGSTIVKRLKTKTDQYVKADGTVEFKVRDRVFEISNAPPDVLPDAPIPPNAKSHFHMFYDGLFIQSPPETQYDFVDTGGGAPAPRPALCGVSYLGLREEPL